MTQIPIINMDFNELKEVVWAKIQEPSSQRKIILVIVSIALLLDNMLYMVIVPIIPDYLRYTGAFGTPPPIIGNATPPAHGHEGQDSATGILFASKAIVQLMVNPFSGALIDKIGYDIPMMIGLTIMFLSTAVFACGRSYGVLFFARSLQGVGSAFADTSGLAMIADRFTEENERSKALGIALAFISFGCLVAPPFGGALYQFAGKEVPFLILAFVSLADGFMLLLVMKPLKEQIKDSHREKPPSIPIWRLFIDPYIAVCAGALMMSNVALAFLEPTISLWMEDNMTTENWKIGMIWLPAFFPHVFGVIITVKMARQYPQHQWLMAAIGLVIEGLSCFIVPFSSSYKVLMIPICGICFGIALIDTALLPTLGYLVDVRYVSVYGSIYAIADISYSLAYAVGPIIAGGVVEAIGFPALNFGIAFANLLYAPVLMYLRHIYDFKPFESEANILMADPPDKKYQTYAMHDATSANPTPVAGEVKNHLEYSRFQETNVDNENAANNYNVANNESNYYDSQSQPQAQPQGYQQYDQQSSQGYQGYEQQAPSYQQQPSQAYQRPQAQQPTSRDTNPFRSTPAPAVPPPPANVTESNANKNPFRQGYGWKDSIWSLPKRLFSTTAGSGEAGSSVGSAGGEEAAEQTREFDAELPRLPVPQLEHTLAKYLQMARVLVTDAQYERTRATVRAFGGPGGVAHRLQNLLLERQLNEENWAYDWWQSDMYLGNPLSLPINSNPGMVLPPREWKGPHDQARFVARLAACLLKHKESLDRGELAVERATSREKGQPMCMSQFYRLLTSCRIPGRPQDQLNTLPNGPLSDEHVIVACKNKFYVLPVKQGGRNIVEDEIAMQVQAILQDTSPNVKPIGLLSADRRDVWADTREHLMHHSGNRKNLTLIERSLALICLDEPLPPSFNYGSLWHADEGSSPGNARGHILGARDETNMAHEMIHGGGSALNSGNRWFDKTVQLVISSDGAWGLCYEHSPAEGVAVVRLLEQLLDQCRDCSSNKPLPIPRTGLIPPKPLEWYISERISRSIQEAGRNIDCLLEDLDFYVYRYTGYGKEFIKSCKVSPDAYIQLALQLAYYRLNQKLTATYESASTRRFRLGRVDCIRSASSEARAWADAMCQAEMAEVEAEGRRVTFSVADEKRVTLFDAAVARQTQEMVDNILGLGIDIHLLGLRQAAVALNEPEPEFFQDPTFAKMNHFALSTSQVATKCDGFMGYGPVVPDGYGASYNPKSDSIIFCLSAFHSSDATSTWQFAHSLKTSLNNMKQLLAARQAA